MFSHRDIVELLEPVEIRPINDDGSQGHLKSVAAILGVLGINVAMVSETAMDHIDADPADDELVFLVNEIVRRRFAPVD